MDSRRGIGEIGDEREGYEAVRQSDGCALSWLLSVGVCLHFLILSVGNLMQISIYLHIADLQRQILKFDCEQLAGLGAGFEHSQEPS